MSLTTPQSITVDAVATDFHRIEDGKNSSIYQSADGNFKLTVSHQLGKTRCRRMMRLDKRILAADPLTSINAYQTAGVYLVIDEPTTGFTDTQLNDLVTSLKTWATTTNIAAVLASRH